MATTIASQALISGVFSLTHQAVQLGYFPRVTVNHTSREAEGQIYVPLLNWGLLVACIALVVGLKSRRRLASAYGIAVSGRGARAACLKPDDQREARDEQAPVEEGRVTVAPRPRGICALAGGSTPTLSHWWVSEKTPLMSACEAMVVAIAASAEMRAYIPSLEGACEKTVWRCSSARATRERPLAQVPAARKHREPAPTTRRGPGGDRVPDVGVERLSPGDGEDDDAPDRQPAEAVAHCGTPGLRESESAPRNLGAFQDLPRARGTARIVTKEKGHHGPEDAAHGPSCHAVARAKSAIRTTHVRWGRRTAWTQARRARGPRWR